MSKPRAGRVIRAWAVVCSDGTVCQPWAGFHPTRIYALAHVEDLDGDFGVCAGPPHTVIPLTGAWKPPAKKKGRR